MAKKNKREDAFKESMAKKLGIEEPPKRKGRKPKDPALIKEFYDRANKIFNPENGLVHRVFVGVKDAQKIREDTPVGTRVLVARYPDFYKLYLYDFKLVGSPHYPYGGVKVWNSTHGQMQSFYYDSVAIHPVGDTHRFERVEEIDVDSLEPIKE